MNAANKEHYENLLRVYENEAAAIKKEQEEIQKINSQIVDLQTQSFSLHLENERLLDLQEREIRRYRMLNASFTESLTTVHDGIEKIDGQIHDVLTDYASHQKAEREIVVRAFQTYRDVPKNYSDEVMKEKIIDIDEKIKNITEEIKKEEAEFIEIKANYQLELERTKDRDESFETFVSDLKKTNIKLQMQLPKN